MGNSSFLIPHFLHYTLTMFLPSTTIEPLQIMNIFDLNGQSKTAKIVQLSKNDFFNAVRH